MVIRLHPLCLLVLLVKYMQNTVVVCDRELPCESCLEIHLFIVVTTPQLFHLYRDCEPVLETTQHYQVAAVLKVLYL